MTAYLLHTLKIGLRFINKEDATICPRKSVCYDHSQAQPLQTLRHKGLDSFLVEFRNLFAKELPSIMLHRRMQVASDFSERNYRRVIERIDIRLYSSPLPSVHSTLSPVVTCVMVLFYVQTLCPSLIVFHDGELWVVGRVKGRRPTWTSKSPVLSFTAQSVILVFRKKKNMKIAFVRTYPWSEWMVGHVILDTYSWLCRQEPTKSVNWRQLEASLLSACSLQ
jgi:hypothetical protein